MELPDIQKTLDLREVPIQTVGVTQIKVPIRIKRMVESKIISDYTVAEFEMGVSLPAEVKGTHMSRFSQVLTEFLQEDACLNCDMNIADLHEKVLDRLGAVRASIRATFPFFVPQPSPVTSTEGVAPVSVTLEVTGSLTRRVERTTVRVNGKTVCPCSREISEYSKSDGRGKGAHAQRSEITLSVDHLTVVFVPIEDLVDICFKSFSSPVYPVLKRPDERAVTMSAYENPKFVEDVIRDTAVNLRKWSSDKGGLLTYSIRVQNAESIHYHDAFAEVSGAF